MKKSASRIENERKWKALVERSKLRTGSLEEFCKAEGVSSPSFGYWRHKFGRSNRAFAPSIKSVSKLPAFSRVEILEPQSSRPGPPNAKWVAEIILHIHRGMTA